MNHPNSKIELEEVYNETHSDYIPENFDLEEDMETDMEDFPY